MTASHSRFAVALAAMMLILSSTAREIRVADAEIDVRFPGGSSAEFQAVGGRWIERAATAVTAYYGDFPVRGLVIKISERSGRKASGGQSFAWRGPLITISLGRDATDADLANDWLLTHEMFHQGFPSVPERHHWLEEGIATYAEPIARVRAGQMSPEHAWRDLVEGLPQGQPESGDRGLDFTHTWGRTYWGGALFCLRADVKIRQRTENRKGLEHALRAIREHGGNITVEWPIDRVISVGDRATGVPVLRELYDEMSAKPVRVDLDALWQQLGVRLHDRTVSFDDSAPLSAIRRAIMTP